MNPRPAHLALALGLLLLGACTEPEPSVGPPGRGGGIAVVASDYTSTVVSLVDPATGMVRDRCLDSGSRAPQLSAALSGDVTLPSNPLPERELLVIDRKQSTLTWLDPERCQVLRQMNVGDGFSANPHDVVAGPGDKAYVTRYDRNPGRPEEGSDLLVIDRARATRLGTVPLPVPSPSALTGGQVLSARPARAALVGDRLYVVLNNLSDDFEAAASGRVAVVDTTSDRVVASIDLPGLKNCGALLRVPAGGTDALVVGCSGVYSDGPLQIDSAGFAWIDLDVSPPAVAIVPGRTFERTVSGSILAVAGAARAFTVLSGDPAGGRPDEAWSFDFRGGRPRKLLDGSGAFVLSLALDRAAGRLYLLDASRTRPLVHRHELRADGTTTPAGSFEASPASGLPPRHLGFY